jgi:hypothetical protein
MLIFLTRHIDSTLSSTVTLTLNSIVICISCAHARSLKLEQHSSRRRLGTCLLLKEGGFDPRPLLWFDTGQPLVTSSPTAVNPLLTRGIQNKVHIRATLHVVSLPRILAAGPLLFNLG